MCVIALILGMLVFHMLKGVCGCKVVEGQFIPSTDVCKCLIAEDRTAGMHNNTYYSATGILRLENHGRSQCHTYGMTRFPSICKDYYDMDKGEWINDGVKCHRYGDRWGYNGVTNEWECLE